MRNATLKSVLRGVLLTAAALLVSGTHCESKPPRIPAKPIGPTFVTLDDTATYATFTTDPDRYRVKYTFGWGDGTADTTDYFESGDTATASHVWHTVGVFPVKVWAEDETGRRAVDCSDTLTVTVDCYSPYHPPDTPTRPTHTGIDSVLKPITFATSANDPDGDSVQMKFHFGDGGTPPFGPKVASGATFTDTVYYNTNGWKVIYAVATDGRDTSVWSAPDSIFIHSPASPRLPRP